MKRKQLLKAVNAVVGETYFCVPPNLESGFVEVMDFDSKRGMVTVKEASTTGEAGESESKWIGIVPLGWLFEMPTEVTNSEDA